ncbi:CAP domain-containing protein [Syncephalis pseudoplumigaleata]|uniref:CAP domain-containing protein n=1 Tax=Syncephalis pseudoplumigaleata TaxID=1712513 RepID=A0A4P9YVM0_9FUNG|nr:CAP domain-containing protein [Syncephalis pseudoplumigaleata]|eukprot:RKP24086.1 CAP domain-containing protein [Syncephalis pseudoplumigaleata]
MRATPIALVTATLLVISQHMTEAFDRRTMLCLTNKERVRRGLNALGPSACLDNAAQRHSNDQARNSFMDHTGSDGSDPGARIDDAGYKWRTCRENVAYGQKDEREVIEGWMDSQGHRENILNPEVTHHGSAVAYKGSTPYYTQVFAADDTKSAAYPECPKVYSYADSPASAPAPAPAPSPPAYAEKEEPAAPSAYGDSDTYGTTSDNDDSSDTYSSYSVNEDIFPVLTQDSVNLAAGQRVPLRFGRRFQRFQAHVLV